MSVAQLAAAIAIDVDDMCPLSPGGTEFPGSGTAAPRTRPHSHPDLIACRRATLGWLCRAVDGYGAKVRAGELSAATFE